MLPAGNELINSPLLKKLVAPIGTMVPKGMLFGHEAAPFVAVHATDLQLRPCEAASLIKAPLAADGPKLLNVRMYVVVLPASKEVVPLSLLTPKLASSVTAAVAMPEFTAPPAKLTRAKLS